MFRDTLLDSVIERYLLYIHSVSSLCMCVCVCVCVCVCLYVRESKTEAGCV